MKFRTPAEAKSFFLWVLADPFPGGKARPGRDADHSASYNVEVENE
jgi:hypothetical protein